MPSIALSMRLAALPMLALLAGPAAALADDISMPAYKPEIGVERHYRVLRQAEMDMSLWMPEMPMGRTEMEGEFRTSATVLSSDENGYEVRWVLDAAVPDDAAEGRHELNEQYRHVLATYGVEAVTLKTDAAGRPTEVVEAAEILAGMEEKLKGTEDPLGAGEVFVEQIKADPLSITDMLVAEAGLLATAQGTGGTTATEGHSWTNESTTSLDGIDVTTFTKWTLEAVDPDTNTAQLYLTESADSEQLTQALEEPINRVIGSFPQQAEALNEDELATARTATREKSARFILSLESGETLEATERVVTHSAGIRAVTTAHLYREDITPRLTLEAETP